MSLKPVSNTNCCVYGCKSIRKKNPELSFHMFPKQGEKIFFQDEFGQMNRVDRKKLWETKLKMGKRATTAMLVCSLHFQDSDYECSGWSSQKRLSKSAVPSKNLPLRSCDKSNGDAENLSKKSRDERAVKRCKIFSERKMAKVEVNVLHEGNSEDNSTTNSTGTDAQNEEVQEAIEGLLQLSSSVCSCQCHNIACTSVAVQTGVENKVFMNEAVQVNTSDSCTIMDFIKTDDQLNSLTGIASFEMFNNILLMLSLIFVDKRIHKLSLKQRLLLFLMKLKLNLPYVVLSILFSVSSETCKRIFFNVSRTAGPVFRKAIRFPPLEEIRNNIPKCFRDFQKVRIVLDCTEIPLQKHKRLCCRIKTYSHYKGMHTIKFMTGVSSAGLITFVSRPYGGRTSDKVIFEQSGLIDKLEIFEDQIVVDKGFLIEDVCDQYGIKLIRPPFLRKKEQFSPAEAMQNVKIAAARVHIERSNQRIKVFQIFRNPLSVSLIPIIEDLFVIVCAIVNLSSPILADDKFL